MYTYQEKQIFFNKDPFPNDKLRLLIIGNSGSGKTKLFFKLLLNNYLDFKKLVFCSPSLSQKEYEVIIKCLENKLSIDQIRVIFEQQNDIKDIDKAIRNYYEK